MRPMCLLHLNSFPKQSYQNELYPLKLRCILLKHMAFSYILLELVENKLHTILRHRVDLISIEIDSISYAVLYRVCFVPEVPELFISSNILFDPK